jgi:hypothetical protein
VQRVITMGRVAKNHVTTTYGPPIVGARTWGDPTYDPTDPDDDPNDPTTWTGPDDGSGSGGGSTYEDSAAGPTSTAGSSGSVSSSSSSGIGIGLGVPILTSRQLLTYAAAAALLGYALVRYRSRF